MKYIRTKDGIKAYNETCDLSYVYQCIGGIKVADTIEELCDEFVYKEEVFDKRLLKTFRKLGREIYGAIWTDKGLIYVAKMNDKGELELL